MFLKAPSLSSLFAINKDRQREMDRLVATMGDYPTNDELTLLHDIVDHSVPEAKALLLAITNSFNGYEPVPRHRIVQMLSHQSSLPKQIEDDQKLKKYLEDGYRHLTVKTPR